MLKEQVKYLVMVSLKYFFNLDHSFSSQLLIMIVLIAGCCKQLFADAINEGIRSAQNGVTYIKAIKERMKENMMDKNEKILAYHTRPFRNYHQKDIQNWHVNK